MTHSLKKIQYEYSHPQHSIVTKRLSRESGGPNSIPPNTWKLDV